MSATIEIDSFLADGDVEGPKRSGALVRVLRKPLGLISFVLLAIVIVLGLLEPVLGAHDPAFSSLEHINAPVGTEGYLLGGDQYGRDIWARVLASINVSVVSALIGAGVGIVVGTTFGLVSGYVGKRTDATVSWVFNLLMTFPALVLVMVLQPVFGGGYQVMMVIFGVFLSPGIFRIVRNLVSGVRNELYVDAARVSGLSNRRILSRHVLYVVRGPIIIAGSFMASAAIGVQAGLAFLGFGSTLTPSFGSMTGDAFANLYTAPVQILWPALFLAVLSGGPVLLGNAYRDVLAGPQGTAKKHRTQQATQVVPAAGDGAPTPTPTDTDTDTATAPPAPAATSGSATAVEEGPSGTGTGLLSVRNLWVSYPQVDGSDKAVVRGISLDIGLGEIVGLVGESGSGKSQTAYSILGLLPREAQVRADVLSVAGESLLGSGARGLRRVRGSVISYIPQEPMANLDPAFTVGSQLCEGLRSGMSRAEAKSTVLELLDRVGINDPLRTFSSYPHQISGGMAQRVLIAGAIATRPKLLIADEPTTALDVTVQAEILDLLRDLQGEYGMGVLLVTHNFGVVADLCERVLVMREGEIVEDGDVRSIFHTPTHPYTQELIGSILDEDTVRTDPAPGSVPAPGADPAPGTGTDPVDLQEMPR